MLRTSRSTYTRASQKDSARAVSLDADQMQRISLVLNIHAVLRLVFDNPENVYGFPSMENRNDFFNGRTPLEIMAQGDMVTLYEPLRQIECYGVPRMMLIDLPILEGESPQAYCLANSTRSRRRRPRTAVHNRQKPAKCGQLRRVSSPSLKLAGLYRHRGDSDR